MKNLNRSLLVVTLLSSISFTSQSALVVETSSSANPFKDSCVGTDVVTLQNVTETADPGTIGLVNDYGATTCGQYDNNDKPDPTQNIGYLNDGFMNATSTYLDSLKAGSTIGGYDYTDFIYPPDLLQQLGLGENEPAGSDPDAFNDPGWIKLGKMDAEDDFEYSEVNGTLLSELLEVFVEVDESGKSGTWELRVKETAVDDAEAILGREAKFDHLAIVLKGGDGLAIYDFNFTDIFAREATDGNNVFNFGTPYTLNGDWSMAELLNKGGNIPALSHFSMWVRDPLTLRDVPAPGAGLLLLLGAGILLRRKR